ncbi:hypothetical protein [Arthrobacter sp. CAN_A1]|uniref:hypothetical protein n=1 Tax=Arthrobacter sp. CAN_A1 TaxID=2787717 RepID=UPI0018C9CD79
MPQVLGRVNVLVTVDRAKAGIVGALYSGQMKKKPFTQAPVDFPLSRTTRNLGRTTAVVGSAAAAVALALILWFIVLLLDENDVVSISFDVEEQGAAIAVPALIALAASSIPVTVLWSGWKATGRRDLYRATSAAGDGTRPSDKQTRSFLHDAHPWEPAAMTVLAWAMLGVLAGSVFVGAIYLGRRPDELPLGHLLLGLTILLIIMVVVFLRLLRRLNALARDSKNERERRWPLPQNSELRRSLQRSSGGGESMNAGANI